MDKRQKNKKLIAQNKRNRIVNRRYTSTIKTLRKLLKHTYNIYKSSANSESNEEIKINLFKICNKMYSILDKAVKKRVIHKNCAARKKSKISNFQKKL
jgi:small subunit ribosomal protein S20